MGIEQQKIVLYSLYLTKHPRVAFLRRLAELICANGIAGSVAECGVYCGHFASYINGYFPDRNLYLFDTFEGFDERDIERETPTTEFNKWISDWSEYFRKGSKEMTLLRCPNKDKVIIRQGYVPDTFAGLENETFAFVNLDMDLYAPQLAALRFFAPRMSRGGIILLHDYYVEELAGVKQAVDEFSKECNFTRMPIGDDCSIALLIK